MIPLVILYNQNILVITIFSAYKETQHNPPTVCPVQTKLPKQLCYVGQDD